MTEVVDLAAARSSRPDREPRKVEGGGELVQLSDAQHQLVELLTTLKRAAETGHVVALAGAALYADGAAAVLHAGECETVGDSAMMHLHLAMVRDEITMGVAELLDVDDEEWDGEGGG